jgi:spermidine synthase
MAEKRWLPETLFDDLGFRMTYAVEKVLYEQQTEHQHSCCSSTSISARC